MEVSGRGGTVPYYEWGCVHGRFQPFHCGHLEYVLLAKERCRRLVVGITNPDPGWARTAEAASPHRHEPDANPFTYFERDLMVRDSLLAAGVPPGAFVVVPFPIQDPELCGYYVPDGGVHLVRVYSDWEREKVRRLREGGFAVEVLDPEGAKNISGTEVRRRILAGLPWEYLVPDASASVVRRTKFAPDTPSG